MLKLMQLLYLVFGKDRHDQHILSTRNTCLLDFTHKTVILQVDLTEFVAVNSATAHPHWDPDGTVHNIGHSYKGKPKICTIRIPPKKGQCHCVL